MLCKEQGITITGICAVYEIFVAQKVCSSFSSFFVQIGFFTDFFLFPYPKISFISSISPFLFHFMYYIV